MKYSKTKLNKLLTAVEKVKDEFRDCSVGYRAKPCIDGTFPKYHTLKFFAMPSELRELIKQTVKNIDLNIETYFLMFKEGEDMGLTQLPERCFFINKVHLLSGEATVTVGDKDVVMKAGDFLDLPLNKQHAVSPKSPCMFFIEMQIDNNFNSKEK